MSVGVIILWIILLGIIAYFAWNYYSLRKTANFIDNDEFKHLAKSGQVIDVREPSSFQKKHILGARNFPPAQFKASLTALRKDKPVLLYDNLRGQNIARSIRILKKEGFKSIYVLQDGLDHWNGKIKEK